MEKTMTIRTGFYSSMCAIGGIFGQFLGGYDSLAKALIICMIIDYFSGVIVALVFKNSPKTDTGALQSNAGLKGLAKKIFILLIVAVAVQVDTVLDSNFIRNAIILAFIANELLSILENGGLMGINMPPVLVNAVDILKKKSQSDK